MTPPDPWCPPILTTKTGLWDYVDLFAGAGGWDVAAAELGMDGPGIELDPVACRTRRDALLHTTEDDVRNHHPEDFPAWGLIASPPCQTFSTAGKKNGHGERDVLVRAVYRLGWTRDKFPELDHVHPTSRLVVEPMRWIVESAANGMPYRWVAFEQVPAVLPVWEAYADVLTMAGYHVTTGVLSSERYGVPQTRRRAILLANLDGPVTLPPATHSTYYPRTPDRLDPDTKPWVSVREALWDGGPCPHPETVNDQSGTGYDVDAQTSSPATAVAAKRPLVAFRGANANRFNGATKSRNDGLTYTVPELARLQTFPSTFRFAGTEAQQVRQIGNAIPVLLASAVLRAAITPQ